MIKDEEEILMMSEVSLFAKSLLFELVYRETMKYDDIPENCRIEFEEWRSKYDVKGVSN